MIFLLTCVYSFSNKSRKSFENRKTICIVYMDSEWTSQKQKKKPKIEVWVHVCDEVLVSGYNGDLFQFFQFFFVFVLTKVRHSLLFEYHVCTNVCLWHNQVDIDVASIRWHWPSRKQICRINLHIVPVCEHVFRNRPLILVCH